MLTRGGSANTEIGDGKTLTQEAPLIVSSLQKREGTILLALLRVEVHEQL